MSDERMTESTIAPPGLMSLLRSRESFLGLGLIGVVLIMMIPLSPFFLDSFLIISISAALVIFLISIYLGRAIDFSTFPAILLIVTIFRLALNIASTRLILTEGASGQQAAGSIISTFGSFVVGGNYVVGIIVFIILVVINFIVITKGAGRVAEVAARFTLDGMPGKQMAIDADLNAGLIDEATARERRKLISVEADFYGSMDGSSKFVRGDAIAGIIITIVNIVGGLIIGVVQNGLDLVTAAQTYTVLTVGDGLVTQIPALIISTAAGLVVTKVDMGKTMSDDFYTQVFMQPKAFAVAAVVTGIGALHPNMPFIPFSMATIALVFLAMRSKKAMEDKAQEEEREALEKKMAEEAKSIRRTPEQDPTQWVAPVDLLELEVGYGLVPLVDERQNGDLLKRMTHLRRQFAQEMGFVVPPIHIRDNLQLRQGEYSILVKGVKVSGGELFVDRMLAIDPGTVSSAIEGIETKEPAYGLPAVWIGEENKDQAQLMGYTVVDNSTALATHLSEVIRTNSSQLLGREEVGKLLERLKETHPKVVEDLIPDLMTVGQVMQVLKNLLSEQIPIRDLPTILETLATHSGRTKDSDLLTESVREALSSTITQSFMQEGKLKVLVLDPDLDETIAKSLIRSEDGVQITMEPRKALDMINALQKECDRLAKEGIQPVALTSPSIRMYFRKLIERQVKNCAVISHNEVNSLGQLESVGVVKV
ncbi:MAG: flagellar biosynthesis protein FlhA [Bradymonadales bacterium]|nr:MAG: flagellar biosynthesis protein FlhA [Bradymonadales bacterium]